ncbi:MAG: hypothetical protein MI685_01785 [Chlorobiales bacterium]|nr:hypothetical protein [Chlorobiales bacterium]
MAYKANPFLERMSERTTSDMDFARLFSPKILERLTEDAFDGAVHIFRSAPGAGKTTLLRAFTPAALNAFYRSRHIPELIESFRYLVSHGVVHEDNGPQMLGVILSCASGYADLPPGTDLINEGLFRSLFDCRVVLRTLHSICTLFDISSNEQLDQIRLSYDEAAIDLKNIPLHKEPSKLLTWAEQQEQIVYARLDTYDGPQDENMPLHKRFESILWFQYVRFHFKNRIVAPRRLLMIDDLHKLRRKQRALLLDELTVLRPSVPVWFAERTIALGNDLLSQGVRQGRDLREYALEDMWSSKKGSHQFSTFAQNILDRRMSLQDVVASSSFSQCLQSKFHPDEIRDKVIQGIRSFIDETDSHGINIRYSEWLARARERAEEITIDTLIDIYVTRILIARDEAKRQMTLDLALSAEELEDKDNSQVRGAAKIFIHEELKIPYYYGLNCLCDLATNNIEELLSLSAALYDGLQAKQVLRRPQLVLSPSEQEKILIKAAKLKSQFIPKNHTEGSRALRLLDSIGKFCREKTFQRNAPYAPGVTGVRLSQSEFIKLNALSKPLGSSSEVLIRVLAECSADNLLFLKSSSASTSRECGTIFYLNRTLCSCYGLPVQMGGWQDVSASELINWMERGFVPSRQPKLWG